MWENQTQSWRFPLTPQLPSPQTCRNSSATVTVFVFFFFLLSFYFLLLTSYCARNSGPVFLPSCRVNRFNNTTMAKSSHGESKLKLRVREVVRRGGKHREMCSLSQRSQQCLHNQSIAVVNTLITWGCAKVMVSPWWFVFWVLGTSPHIL